MIDQQEPTEMQESELKKTYLRVDNEVDEVGKLIQDLTQVVEKEVTAFQGLLDALLEQQHSIIEGDAMSVSLSSEEVERMVSRTKKLESERKDKSKVISQHFDSDESLTLTQIIGQVESEYAERLNSLKEMFVNLAEKVQSTNKRNRFLLENSLKFVDESLKILMQGQNKDVAYGRNGKMSSQSRSYFSSMG